MKNKAVILDKNENKIDIVDFVLDATFKISFPIKDREFYKISKNIVKHAVTSESIVISFENLENLKLYNDLMDLLNVILINDTKERYEFIYDLVCERLDNDFESNNYCDFKDDKCILQRNGRCAYPTMGCCYQFEYSKIMSNPIDKGLCKYLDGKKCSQKCITCKLFTCRYLRKKGIKYTVEDIFLLNIFFNRKQKNILKTSFFCAKDEIIEKLLKNK